MCQLNGHVAVVASPLVMPAAQIKSGLLRLSSLAEILSILGKFVYELIDLLETFSSSFLLQLRFFRDAFISCLCQKSTGL